jgi:histidyl-tRNA synthetase
MIDLAVEIDKIDKTGMLAFAEGLEKKQFTKAQIADLSFIGKDFFDFGALKKKFQSEILKKGVEELEHIKEVITGAFNIESKIKFDVSLARGLNYYTGTIIEVKVDIEKCKSEFTSSICGGGRYDDLTGIFGLPNISGVGISFGADRIYDVIEELNCFPQGVTGSTKVMFVNFGEKEAQYCLPLAAELRKNRISTEVYPDAAKFKKQMGYADDKKIAYVVFVGADEMEKGLVKLKNMTSGEEKEIKSDELIKHIV